MLRLLPLPATSILDYTFRELAISYLDRHDLGHVKKDDLNVDTTGGGEVQSELVNRVTSRGFIRKQGLVVYSNERNTSTASAAVATALENATAVENTAELASDEAVLAHRVKEAKLQGYEGESCPECQNFTLVRNGTCLKCNSCGATTGCS